MNRVMKLKSSVGCRGLLAAFIAHACQCGAAFAASGCIDHLGYPSDIVYGTPLGVDQLNAVFTNPTQARRSPVTPPTRLFSNAILNAGDDQVLRVTLYAKVAEQDVEVKVVKRSFKSMLTKAPSDCIHSKRHLLFTVQAGAGAETAAIEALLDANYDVSLYLVLSMEMTLTTISQHWWMFDLDWPGPMLHQAQSHLTDNLCNVALK